MAARSLAEVGTGCPAMPPSPGNDTKRHGHRRGGEKERSKRRTYADGAGAAAEEASDDDGDLGKRPFNFRVEIMKRPGQTLGFYIREGNNEDRDDGVFVSRVAEGSFIETHRLLQLGDEIVAVNGVPISQHRSLDDVVLLMSIPKVLRLDIVRHLAGGKKAAVAAAAEANAAAAQAAIAAASAASNAVVSTHVSVTSSLYRPISSPDSPHSSSSSSSSALRAVVSEVTTQTSSAVVEEPNSANCNRQTVQVQVDDSAFDQQQQPPPPPPPSSEESASASLGGPGDADLSQVVDEEEEEGEADEIEAEEAVEDEEDEEDEEYDEDDLERAELSLQRRLRRFRQQQQARTGATWTQSMIRRRFEAAAAAADYDEPPPPAPQRALDLRRLQLEQQAGEDSNDSGLSSEHSAPSKDGAHGPPPPPAPAPLPAGRSVHFAREHDVIPSPSDSPSPHHFAHRPLHRPHTATGMLGRSAAPRAPMVDRGTQCDPPSYYPTPGARYALPQGYSSDSELHGVYPAHAVPNHASHFGAQAASSRHHRRPGPSYSSGEEDNASALYATALHRFGDDATAAAAAAARYWGQRLRPTLEERELRQQAAGGPSLRNSAPPGGPSFTAGYGRWPPPGPPYEALLSPTGYFPPDSLAGFAASTPLDPYSGFPEPPRGVPPPPPPPSSSSRHRGNSRPGITREEVASSLSGPAASRFRVKDWEIARFAAKVNKDEFRICPSDRSAKGGPAAEAGSAGEEELTGGLLRVHLIAGTGLNASHALLRDLYCVLEVDSIRRARSMIRTSTDYFEWDETFELDFLDGHCLSFLLYHWDPKNRHRLCFYGNLNMRGLAEMLQRGYVRSEKLALKLEPKGLLYMVLHFTDCAHAFRRAPPVDPGVFGTALRVVVERERSGHKVPLVVKCCVDEVAARGLDIVGVYRLSGAEKLKQLVRDAFEKSAGGPVNLRADKVPDIHAITSVLKDYFRELPEPLFTDAMYNMVLGAVQVALPGDCKAGAKLMLNILDCLPCPNQDTLIFVLDHLKTVLHRSDLNKMTLQNLAAVFGPILLYPSPALAKTLDRKSLEPKKQAQILKFILEIWPDSRSSKPEPTVSPPLAPRSKGRLTRQSSYSAPHTNGGRSARRDNSLDARIGYEPIRRGGHSSSSSGGQRSNSLDRR